MLHGMEVMAGAGFVFNGLTHESYLVRYKRLPDCPSHEADAPVEAMTRRSDEMTVGEMLERVRRDLGEDAVLEFNQDLLSGLECAKCGTRDELLASLGKVTESQGRCPRCGEHRIPHTFHTVDGSESFLQRTLREIGVPPWDVVAGRRGMEQRFYEFRADSAEVLGELAASQASPVSPAAIGASQP